MKKLNQKKLKQNYYHKEVIVVELLNLKNIRIIRQIVPP
jgi:hypothetical protein